MKVFGFLGGFWTGSEAELDLSPMDTSGLFLKGSNFLLKFS